MQMTNIAADLSCQFEQFLQQFMTNQPVLKRLALRVKVFG
jgi:hypothetical protein